MTFEQGIEIGRPSRIDVRVLTEKNGSITSVLVGGAAVRVISGEVQL
jgi:predicted PhzF superfamily epimerase YddE/YHI9